MENFLQRIKQEYKKYTEHMDEPDFMIRNSEFLFFPEKTRTAFFQALEAQNTQKAQDLYRKAVEISLIRCERTIGLSISENVELIHAFRERNAEEVIRLMDIAHERRPFQNAKNDTYSMYRKEDSENTNSYKEKDRYYNSRDKQLIKNPITGKEEEMTRTELHDAIIQRFIEGKEKPSETEKTLIFLATGGLPGAGKGTVLKEAVREMIDIPADTNSEHYEKYYVVVDPDAIKPYLPEYYNDDGTLNGSRVHRESGDVADMIREMALKEGYSILYDASMKDSLQFGWYTQIVNEARFQHYEPKVAFVYDGGEAWYRNSVLRDRALPADGYINFMRAYDTFFHLAQKHGIHATMYDNSSRIPRKGSPTKLVVYKDGKALYLDRNLYKNFQHFEVFRKLLLQL